MAEQIYEVREKGGLKRTQALVWETEWCCQYNGYRFKNGAGGAKDTGGPSTSLITRRLKPAAQGSGEAGTTALGAAGLGVFLGELPGSHPGWHSTNTTSGGKETADLAQPQPCLPQPIPSTRVPDVGMGTQKCGCCRRSYKFLPGLGIPLGVTPGWEALGECLLVSIGDLTSPLQQYPKLDVPSKLFLSPFPMDRQRVK